MDSKALVVCEIRQGFYFLKGENEMWFKNRKCPICKKNKIEYPALSRKDNKTKICTECGIREALEDFINYQKGEKRR